MPITLKKYPFDPSGTAASNTVTGELHTIGTGKVRSIVPLYAPFYAQSVRVYDRVTGQPLIHNIQYQSLYMDETLTLKTRQEVCSVLVIVDSELPDHREVDVHYQAVGGEYTNQQSVILSLLQGMDLDDRDVNWSDIGGKPSGFTPKAHQHDIGDVYGWEFVLNQLKKIREAILLGDRASHEEILRVFRQGGSQVDQDIETVRGTVLDSLNAHIARSDNPHNTTREQVGLGKVPNYPPADNETTLEGLSDEHVVVPSGVRYAVGALAGGPLDAHIARTDNPHNTTKEQVGLGSVMNYPTATDEEARQGIDDEVYITSYGVKLQIQTQALLPLEIHESMDNNPHGTTKAQVGLGNVPNYPPATMQQATQGEDDASLLTPQGAWLAIQALFTDPITQHKARTDNPHGVTKAQVGLSDVDNFSKSYYDARYAPVMHSHTYDDLPFSLLDTVRWNQAKTDLETLPSFNPDGLYPGLRAGGTRAADVGLGEAPNWSLSMFTERYALKEHTHDEFLSESEAESLYISLDKWSELIDYAETYSDYAIDRYLKGLSTLYPNPPSI